VFVVVRRVEIFKSSCVCGVIRVRLSSRAKVSKLVSDSSVAADPLYSAAPRSSPQWQAGMRMPDGLGAKVIRNYRITAVRRDE